MLLSFIIPFFNGKKYIEDCLDSLFNQDISEALYEVIIVNDCSTDQPSLEIINSYAKKHHNIRILENDRNLRVGGTRNHGLRNAKGKYIWFIDQDDKIEPNCISILLNECETNNLDYITFDYIDFDDLGQYKPHNIVTNNTMLMTGLEYAYKICNKNIWNNQWDTNVWHQIYNREFLIKHNIFFTEISYFDDMIVALKSLIYAKKMLAVTSGYYHYRYNESSVLHSEVGYSGRTVFDFSVSASVVLLKLSQEIKQIDEFFYNHFIEAASYRANTFTKPLLRISYKQKKCFFRLVNEHKKWVETIQPYLSLFNRLLINNPWITHILHPFVKSYRNLKHGK